MVDNAFALHEISGQDQVTFPFNIKDYQRYVFGDDRLAHRFGTDCAKAFIAHISGSKAAQPTTTTTASNQTAASYPTTSPRPPTACGTTSSLI
jgi:hypothetical protein